MIVYRTKAARRDAHAVKLIMPPFTVILFSSSSSSSSRCILQMFFVN